jgi:hypothetical protein
MVAGTARIQDLITGGSELDLEGFELSDELSSHRKICRYRQVPGFNGRSEVEIGRASCRERV